MLSCSHSSPYISDRIPADIEIKPPAETDIQSRVILIGDAGEPKKKTAVVLAGLTKWGKQMPEKTMILILGDNIYPDGLPPEGDPTREDAVGRLKPQIDAVIASGAKGIFIPGNHDWRETGQKRVLEQQKFVNKHLSGYKSFLPENGSPGPESIDLLGVRIIILDTEWWLRKDSSEAGNTKSQKQKVTAAVTELTASAGEREVIIAAHHPFLTAGEHGGHFGWKDHIFPLTNVKSWLWLPLPIIGSLYPISRYHIYKHRQDLSGTLNKEMVNSLSSAFEKHKPLVYAAGHEHSLQILDGGNAADYMLVSGAGAKNTTVWHNKHSLFSHSAKGFMVLDFLNDKRVLLRIVEPETEEEIPLSMWLRE